MTYSEAKAALLEMGIKNPSQSLLQDYIRANGATLSAQEPTQESALEPTEPQAGENPAAPRPSSKSNLKPLLVARGELVREHPRKSGRPKIQAPWFQAVATVMSDGTPLRQALAAVGVYGLTERQIRSLYRNSVLKEMRREARQKWLREWGVRPRARRRHGCKGGLPLGMPPQMHRIL